ncbi:MAG: hypothetical protein JRJ56_09235, partial [Deltaproteobacteria bacterium]|nr:hypothetical protein [Deltaproteobacteria bacterium]
MNSDRQNHAPACRLEAVKNYRQPGLASRTAGKNDVDCRQAVAEAKRCLVNHPCTGCDLCRWLCPDL